MFHLKEFSVLNDLRPFMRLRYDQFFDKYEYHGFQIFFLFEDIFFSFFFIITQEVEYYLPTRRGNQLMYIDSDGTKYYLSETVKLVRRNLEEAKEYVKDYILEVDENINEINILIDKQANNAIVSETHSGQAKLDNVFEALETKLALTEILFKLKLETMAKERIMENITQKDWFYNAFKNAGY